MGESSAQRVRFRVSEKDAGSRLDQVLARSIPQLSRRKARVLLDIGGVFVDRKRVKIAGRQVRAGQVIEAHLGGALDRATGRIGKAARDRDAATLPRYEIVHIDDDVIIVDKPTGLLSAPTPESDRNNLADLLARHDAIPPEDRTRQRALFVVHRIDLETSGLLVFARNESSNRALAADFRVHHITREYLCVVQGALAENACSIRTSVAGRPAVTHLAVEERLEAAATLLRARLETGRTHQIRIHCRDAGHAVLGDRRYGRRTRSDPPRLALHATRLGFRHPRTGAYLEKESPWPADLRSWLETLRHT